MKSEMRKITAASTNTNTKYQMKSASTTANHHHQTTKGTRIDSSTLPSAFSNIPNPSGNKPITASGSKRGRHATQAHALSPPSPVARSITSSSSYKNDSTIADLRSLVDSSNRSLDVHLDLTHNHVTEEFDLSLGRMSKRVKTQTKARLHLTEDTGNDCTRISDRIIGNTGHSRSSYKEITGDTQAAQPRVHMVPSAKLAKSTGSTGKALKRSYTSF